MKKIVVASNNPGKLKEIKDIFSEAKIIPIKILEEELGRALDIEENENTFSKNAMFKARMLYDQIGNDYVVLADDSGISIDGLNGFPGVHTRRWMNANDHIKNLALIEKMEGNNNRTCHYTTAIAVYGNNLSIVKECTLTGTMTKEVRGENGFGFDEIFELSNGKTLAQLTNEEKYEISPRKKVLEEIKKVFV